MVWVEDLGTTDDIENEEIMGITNANFVDDGNESYTSNPKPNTSSIYFYQASPDLGIEIGLSFVWLAGYVWKTFC